MKTLLTALQFALLATTLATLTGCGSVASSRAVPEPAPPQTYAVVLFLPEGEEITEEERVEVFAFARETLLASGLVQTQDVQIDDPERAELLFRARVQNGQLTEIAGVPTFNQQHMVVLSQPRRAENRIWWDAYYPFGYPTFNDSYYYSGFPYPGPGWGYPTHYHDRVNRGRGRPRGDYVDPDHRDQRPPNGTPTDRPGRNHGDREHVDTSPSTRVPFRGDTRNLEPGDRLRPRPSEPTVPRSSPAPVVARPSSTPTPSMPPPPPRQSPAPSREPTYSPAPARETTPSYTPPPADRAEPTPREQYYSSPPRDID